MEGVNDILTALLTAVGLIAALLGIAKFKLYQLFGQKYKSSFTASHQTLKDGSIIFEGDYHISNTGQRPITLSKVELTMVGSKIKEGNLIFPDESRELAKRTFDETDPVLNKLLKLSAGEGATFPLRCKLTELPETMFVCCRFEWNHPRPPAPYISMYVRSRGETFRNSEDTKVVGPDAES